MHHQNDNSENTDWFRYPIDWQQVKNYQLSTLIGKQRQLVIHEKQGTSIQFCEGPYCLNNGRVVTKIPDFKCCQSMDTITKRYGIYGPNCVIYLGFIKRLAIFMVFCSCLLAGVLLALNATNDMCTGYTACFSQLVTYTISLFNIINRPGTLQTEVIIWLIVSVILAFFFLHLRIYAINTYKKINNENVTQADYGIIISRISRKNNNKQCIEQLIQTIKQQILQNQQKQVDPAKKMSIDQINKMMKIQYIVNMCKVDKVLRNLHSQVDRFKDTIKYGGYQHFQKNLFVEKNSLKPSDCAIVVFSSIKANDIIHTISRRNILDIVLNYFFPFVKPRTQFRVKDRHVSIQRAPEPRDLLWANLGFSEMNRLKRKFIFSFLTNLLLVGSAFILYYLAKAQIQANNLALTIAMVFILFIVNSIIGKLLDKALFGQRIDTMTNYGAQKIYLNVIYQSVNLGFFNLAIPLLVKLPNVYEGVQKADLPNYMIITTVFAFLEVHLIFFKEYSGILKKITKYLTKQEVLIKTQHEANEDFKSYKLQLYQKYSKLAQLFLFGLVFGIVSPLCIVISTICFLFVLLYEYILFNSKYSIPQYTRIRLSLAFVNAIQPVVILIGLVNLGFHYLLSLYQKRPIDPNIFALCMTIIVFGACLLLIPWNYVLEKFGFNVESDEQQMLYQDKKEEFELTYQQANPATSLDFRIIVSEKIKQKNNPEVMYRVQRKSHTDRRLVNIQEFAVVR